MTPTSLIERPATEVATRPVFAYVRVSTGHQDAERQREAIPARQATLPDGLPDAPLIWFEDEAVSAWKGKTRPDYEIMLARIAAGEASALIVDTSARLTRKGIAKAMSIFGTLKEVNCRLFTTEGREYDFELSGWVKLMVDAEADERYSAVLSHNVRTGKARLAREGRWPFGPTPPGYRKNDDGYLEETSDLPLISKMFDRFLADQSLASISTFLTANFSAPVLARTKHGTVNRDWVRLLLKTPTYLGIIDHKGERFAAPHTPAVTEETFERTQRKFQQRAQNNHRPARTWAWATIARCGTCDRAMTLKVSKNYGYLRCTNAKCARQDKPIRAATYEASVILHLASVAHVVGNLLVADPSWLTQDDPGQTRIDTRRKLEDAEQRLSEMAELVKARAITTADPDLKIAIEDRNTAEVAFERACREGESPRESLDALVRSIESLADLAPRDDQMRLDSGPSVTYNGRTITEHTIARIWDGWLRADFAARRAVLTAALETVTVGQSEVEIKYRIGIPMPVTFCPAFDSSARGAEASDLREAGFGVGRNVTPSR